MNLITISDGVTKINNNEIDGILIDVNVKGEVIYTEEKLDNLSGTRKVPMGWTDADISITYELLTDDNATCYDRLSKLNTLFKTRGSGPQVFDISNRHLSARGVRRVTFSRLESSENNQDDIITATLHFTEYEPSVQKEELGESSVGVSGTTSAEPIPETSIMIDVR